MGQNAIKVLLIEDDPQDVEYLRQILSEDANASFELESVERLQAGIQSLSKGLTDVVLLDLTLPDSRGLDTFMRLYTQAFETPIVILSGLRDETLALEAVRNGAQDYLVKGEVDGKMLSRVMRYAIERQRMQVTLRSLSLIDDLTGLYNRRGFLALADHHLKLAQRTKRGFFLIYTDLDGLKQINDSFGHQEGDLALIDTAEVLRGTFRKSDILARIGGDEFAIIAIEAHKDSSEIIARRLQDTLKEYRAGKNRRYHLSLSVGVTNFEVAGTHSILGLMAKADQALYEHKRSKRAP